MRVPLAWKNLIHRPTRLVAAISGISFAVVLMFTQTGFRNALLDSTVKVIDDMDADILIINKGMYALPAQQRFSRQRIYQARSCPGVANAYPVYMEAYYGRLKRPKHKGHPIRVLAFDPGTPVFRHQASNHEVRQLDQPRTALIDSKSKAKFGFADGPLKEGDQDSFELADRSVRLVGTFSLGTDFANDGNLIMSARNFAHYFPHRAEGADPLSVVDIGIVNVAPGANVAEVTKQLQTLLPNDVTVLAKEDFSRREKGFWNDSTPIGYIFLVGTIMGFIVGVIICYQIIFTSISDHIPEFATLKAMGYHRRFFVRVVLSESIYLSLLGFAPGLLISFILYSGLANHTGLMMVLNVPRVTLVYGLTLGMCVISGALAMRKVLSADPAELF
jgi:putative ABC transport system permease protein